MNVRDLLLSLLLGIFLAVVLPVVLRPIIRRASLNSNRYAMFTGNSLQRTLFVPLSIPVIASLLTEYYDLLISLAYFTRDEISFPPHTIDTELCTRLNLSAAVIETMRSIPFPRTYHIGFCNPCTLVPVLSSSPTQKTSSCLATHGCRSKKAGITKIWPAR